MKYVILLINICFFAPCIYGQSPESIEKIDGIRAEMQQMAEQNKLSQMADLYTMDAVVNGYDGFLKGKEEIAAYWTNLRGEGVSWEWKDLSYCGSDKWVTQTGISLLTLRYGANEVTYSTRFSVVWEKQTDDSYKIVSDFYRPVEEKSGD